MTARRIAAVLTVVLIALAAWMFAATFADLPAQVVTRVNSQGQPETVIAKAHFAALYLVVLAGGGLYFLACYRYIHRLPERYLRFLPHHGYWLDPTRRDQTMLSVSSLLCWLAALTLLLFTASFGLMLALNTGRHVPFGTTIAGLLDTVYLTALFGLVIIFRRRFGKLPEGDA